MSALSKSLCGRFIRSTVCALTKGSQNDAFVGARCLSTTPICLKDSDDEGSGRGWFGRLRKTAQPSDVSHSMALSSKENVYELQFHAVKPENMEEYLNLFSQYINLLKEKGSGAKLVGSFTVEIGEQDEAVHIWQYEGGYPVLNESQVLYRTDSDFKEFRKKRNQMLRYRRNQILLAFSFFPDIAPREPSHIYELRSYTLKPGTMYEWGNCWAKGIHYRKAGNEPVAGLFSQIGEQNLVEHLWGYKDLQTRKETREAAWSRPGWDECVHYTVPLIRHMKSRILIPTPFSPLQ